MALMLQTTMTINLTKNLDRVFKADRNSFMAELSSNAIDVYLLETKQIHNDSTSILFWANMKTKTPKLLNSSTFSTKTIGLTASRLFSDWISLLMEMSPYRLNYLMEIAPMIQPISPIGMLFKNSWEKRILYILPTANYVHRKT